MSSPPDTNLTLPLMPWPRSVVGLDDPNWLTVHGFDVADTSALSPLLRAGVARLTQPAAVASSGQHLRLPLSIRCAKHLTQPQLGDDESYRLRVSPQGVELEAATTWGALHGLTSLAQLWHAGAWLPLCELMDAPRFAWRGVMLDPARRFLPLPVLLNTLDAMARCKLNVLHLHLSDDQGFRFRSTAYPKLASADSYSMQELTQLVEQASALGIRVVPELDIPGHCTSWLTAYPDWGSATTKPSTRFGVHKACLDPTNPEVMQAVGSLLQELAEVFPDDYQHIGGDEVHPAWWSEDAGIQQYMREHQLAEPADLQAQFNAAVAQRVHNLERRMVAWDEVLHPQFGPQPDAPPIVVQNWRGATSRDRAIAAGHQCVVSSGYYLDLMYPADLHYRFDPGASEQSLLALEDEMLDDVRLKHVADGMRWTLQWRAAAEVGRKGINTAGESQLLGGEACLWGELVDAQCLNLRLWSRMPAIAERFWSPAERTDLTDMYTRLQAWQLAIATLGDINLHAEQRAALAGLGIDEPWMTLVELVEPVKWYARLLGEQALQARLAGTEMPQARPYQTTTALNRWVDHLWPESFTAVGLRQWLAHAAPDEVAAQAEAWLSLAAQPGCPHELQTMADRLQQLAQILLAVVQDELEPGVAVEQLIPLAEPCEEVLLAVVWPVVQWLQEQ